jgi:hypothetical protein
MFSSDNIKAILLGVFSSLLAEGIIAIAKWAIQLIRESQHRIGNRKNKLTSSRVSITLWGFIVLLARALVGGYWAVLASLLFIVFSANMRISLFCSLFDTRRELVVTSAFIFGGAIAICRHILERGINRSFPTIRRTHYLDLILLVPGAAAMGFFVVPLLFGILLIVPCATHFEPITTLPFFSLQEKIISAAITAFAAFVVNVHQKDVNDNARIL